MGVFVFVRRLVHRQMMTMEHYSFNSTPAARKAPISLPSPSKAIEIACNRDAFIDLNDVQSPFICETGSIDALHVTHEADKESSAANLIDTDT